MFFILIRLNYMWKHLNVRDKHKYYETATKARNMYDLPEYIDPSSKIFFLALNTPSYLDIFKIVYI